MTYKLSSKFDIRPQLKTEIMNTVDWFVDELPRLTFGAWDLDSDNVGRTILLLTVNDSFGTATARFIPQDLSSERTMRSRFHDIAGDLLQVPSLRTT